MRLSAIAAVLCAAAGPLSALDIDKMSAEQIAARCQTEGGCVVLTRMEIARMQADVDAFIEGDRSGGDGGSAAGAARGCDVVSARWEQGVTHQMLPTPAELLVTAIRPALALLPSRMGGADAERMLLAIAIQESGLRSRWQIIDTQRPEIKGPARSLWQCELGGGCAQAVHHPAIRVWMHDVCQARSVRLDTEAVFARIETDDILAAALARLLLFVDRRPIPHDHEADAAWDMYIDVWRPGKPRPEKWPFSWETARGLV